MGNTGYVPTVLAFCAGYAGIERGLDLAGIKHRVLAYVEIEAFAIANLVAKMESGALDPAPIYTDLKTFPAGIFRDAVDLITGGYPCQPFSSAGKRLGSTDPRHLWPFISEAIGIIRPGRVFFENVEGHISLGLNEVISDLEERGYDTTWGIFSAEEVGAPHQRKRVYILGENPNTRHPERTGWQHTAEVDGGVGCQGRVPGSQPSSLRAPGAGARAGGGYDTEDPGNLARPTDTRLSARGCGARGQSGAEPEPERLRREVADTISPRSAAGVPGQEQCVQEGHAEEPDHGGDRPGGRPGGLQEWGDRDFWPFQAGWCPEPNVGRVVDGCADRVDRIRLLGNGVVPQTAAKAWLALDAELQEPVK